MWPHKFPGCIKVVAITIPQKAQDESVSEDRENGKGPKAGSGEDRQGFSEDALMSVAGKQNRNGWSLMWGRSFMNTI